MSDIFSIIACIGVVILFVSKHREALVKLNKIQKTGVLISFIMTTLIAGFCIYYGSSFLMERFQNGFLILIIRLAVLMITLWFAIFVLNRILQKVTKGIFPKIT